MNTKLYVGNLAKEVTTDQLKKLFSEVGKVVAVKAVTDRESGDSKGFGFVRMNNHKEAAKAIRQLNGQNLEGKKITVSEAQN